MAMNTSGPISLGGATTGQSINLEIGSPATSTVSLNDTIVRTLANVVSGQIVVPTDFYGKSLSSSFFQLFTYPTAVNGFVSQYARQPSLSFSGSDILYNINGSGNFIIKLNNAGTILWSAWNNAVGGTLSAYNPLVQHTNGFIYGAGISSSGATTTFSNAAIYKFNGSTGAYTTGVVFRRPGGSTGSNDPGAFTSIAQSKIGTNLLVVGHSKTGTSPSNATNPKLTSVSYDENLNILAYNRASGGGASTIQSFSFVGTAPDGFAWTAGSVRIFIPTPTTQTNCVPILKLNNNSTWTGTPPVIAVAPSGGAGEFGISARPQTAWESDFSFQYTNQVTVFTPGTPASYFGKISQSGSPSYNYNYAALAGLTNQWAGIMPVVSSNYVFCIAGTNPVYFIAMNKSNGDMAYKFNLTSTTNTFFNITCNLIDGEYMYLSGVINGATNNSFMLKIKTDLSTITSGLTATVSGINITITPVAVDAKTSIAPFAVSTAIDSVAADAFMNHALAATITFNSNPVTETKASI